MSSSKAISVVVKRKYICWPQKLVTSRIYLMKMTTICKVLGNLAPVQGAQRNVTRPSGKLGWVLL